MSLKSVGLLSALVRSCPFALPFASSLWILFTAACDVAPEVGAPIAERCSNEDSDRNTDVSFTRDIQPLLFRANGGCAQCHDPSGSNPVGVQLGGLDLTTFGALRRGGNVSGSNIVVPGEPCNSDLYLKVTAGPRFGSRMPLDGPPFFSEDELELLSDWIAEGADND